MFALILVPLFGLPTSGMKQCLLRHSTVLLLQIGVVAFIIHLVETNGVTGIGIPKSQMTKLLRPDDKVGMPV
jgi:hypothetical protein